MIPINGNLIKTSDTPSVIDVNALIGIIDNLVKDNNTLPINDHTKINNLIEASINKSIIEPDLVINDINKDNMINVINQENINIEKIKSDNVEPDISQPCHELITHSKVEPAKLFSQFLDPPCHELITHSKVETSNLSLEIPCLESQPNFSNQSNLSNQSNPLTKLNTIKTGILTTQKKNVISSIKKKTVTFFPYEFIDLEENNLKLYNVNVILFDYQLSQKYSLGADRYMINYGKDYFTFFRQLGKVKYFIVKHIESKIIIGTLCVILRKFKNKIAIWHFCDLKIDTNHRGQKLTTKILEHIYYRLASITHRGYFITCDPDSEHIIHIINNCNLPIKNYITTKILIYLVSVSEMTQIERYFSCIFGKISYVSLTNIKDIILESTKKSINLYHLHHDRKFEDNKNILSTIKLVNVPIDSTIMFCFPKNSPLEKIILNHNIQTNISATIVSWSMKFFDWHNILTSDF